MLQFGCVGTRRLRGMGRHLAVGCLVQRASRPSRAPPPLGDSGPGERDRHREADRVDCARIVHLTETCDDGTPNLITSSCDATRIDNVETTNAAVSDDAVTATIHATLDARGLLPTTHIADTGFVNSALFVDAREHYGVDLIGPTRGDRQWQAQAGAGFAARDFAIDFAQQRATCPAGKVSQSWTPALVRGTAPVIKIKFSVADCRACPLRPQCTRSTSARRAITIRPEAQHEALRVGRAREQTAEFAVEYARRAGIEGTIAQGVRSSRLRRTP